MSSVVIAGNTSGTVTLSAPDVAGTTTLTLPSNTGNIPVVSGTGTSGQVLTSGGSGAVSTWSTISSGGMTLLGTVTATSGNSVSLGSLDLTNYINLYIVVNGVSANVASWVHVTSDNTQATSTQTFYTNSASDTVYGTGTVNLTSGAMSFLVGPDNANSPQAVGGKTNITTATTTIYFRCASTNTFDAGSIKIYGVK